MNYGKSTFKLLSVLLLSFTFVFTGCKTTENASDSSSESSSRSMRGGPGSGDGEMKKYSEVVTDEAETDEGLFDVHKVDDKYYYEIPDDLLEKEMLLVTR
ncbi:MAG TPA: zinc-dependent metalloprotease, partial [Balneolaceae bacterium]|nr:zinc-dependent metalloprotease [Balneolaceae bacterium]